MCCGFATGWDRMGVEVKVWLWLLVLWRNCGSIESEWVFKACARHRQIFTPVTPQLYNISRMPFSESRPRTRCTIRIRFVTTAVPPLLIVVHNSICQVPPTLFKHQDPDGKPDIPDPTCPAHDQEVDLGFFDTDSDGVPGLRYASGKLRTGG